MAKTQSEKLVEQKSTLGLELLQAVYSPLDDAIIVDADFLKRHFGVKSRQAVSNWFKKGCPTANASDKFVPLREFEKWYDENMDKSKALQRRHKKVKTELPNSVTDWIDTLPQEWQDAYNMSGKDPLDRIKDLKELENKSKDIEKKDIDISVKKGELVPADKLDAGMAELAAIQLGQYMQDLTVMPKKLGISNEQSKMLENEYMQRISQLQKIAKIDSKSKIIDILKILPDILENHSADKVIKALNEL